MDLQVVRDWLDRADPRMLLGIAAGTLVLIVVLVAGSFWAFRGGEETRDPAVDDRQVLFYDLITGTYFTERHTVEPPIETGSETPRTVPASGVRAFIFSCGGCGDPDDRFGYLQTLNAQRESMVLPLEAARGLRATRDGGPYERIGFVRAASPEGQAIVDRVDTQCDGMEPITCDVSIFVER